MTATLERPGVKVTQQFRTTSPLILRPLLASCVVGPARQIVEAVDDAGLLTSDTRISLPAMVALPWVSTPFTYAIANDEIELSVNNGLATTVTVGASAPTTTQLANLFNAAGIAGLLAEVETSGDQRRVVLRTTGTGDNVRIDILAGTDLPTLGLSVSTAVGRGSYNNALNLDLLSSSYPDPRGNIDYLVVDTDSVRAFVRSGTSYVEVSREETVLDGATSSGLTGSSAVVVVEDGDYDNTSPFLTFANRKFGVLNAELVGTVDVTGLTYGVAGSFDPAVTLGLDCSGVLDSLVLDSAIADEDALIVALNAAFAGNATFSLHADGFLIIKSVATDVDSYLTVTNNPAHTANTILGFPDLTFAQSWPSRATQVGGLWSAVDPTALRGRLLRLSVDGLEWRSIVFANSVTTEADVRTAVNAAFPDDVMFTDGFGRVLIHSLSTTGGRESVVYVGTDSDATVLSELQLTPVGVFGNAMAPIPGDELWINGRRRGLITDVVIPNTVTGTPARLRLDTELQTDLVVATWLIRAKNLGNAFATSDRPGADLVVDDQTGTLRLKHGLFVNAIGIPLPVGAYAAHIGYNALRLDVSPAAANPNVQRYETTTDLEEALGPLDTQNPLGLGVWLSMLNAPGVECTGLGVDETNAAAAEGTLDAYVRAFEFLEAKQVYGIAPLTHSIDVGLVLEAHVEMMSEERLERIGLINPLRPTRATDTLVASTATANVTLALPNDVVTDIGNLTSLLDELGLEAGSLTIDDAVFVEFEGDANKYLVESVAGPVITLSTGPHIDNDFFFDAEGADVFTEIVVDRPMSIKIRGLELTSKTDIAVAYADIARGFANRRIIMTAPDQCVVTIDALDTLVPGYYLNAALVGKMAAASPSQPFTEDSIIGIKGVVGSQDYFGEPQLSILSGGGIWVFQKDTDSSPVITRHQLTTDMSSLKTREASIVRAVDASAMYFRGALRNFIGRFNITQTLVDSLSTVSDGIAAYLVKENVMKEIDIIGLRQSADNPDDVEIDVDMQPYYPCNKIRVRMVI